MSKPFSIRTEPWTSFDKQSYFIFTDDFVHEKLLTVKVNQKPGKATINLKNQLAKKDDKLKASGEIKLWFPIWNSRNGYLYFRSRNDQFKLHYDDGLKQIASDKFNYYNIYASYQSSKTFQNAILKLGANLLAKDYNFDNRIRVQFGQNNETDVSTGHKFTWAKNNWSFDAYHIISFKTKALINNAIRITYRQGDNDFFLRAINQDSRSVKHLDFTKVNTYFNKFILDYVRKVDDLTKVGLQSEFTHKNFTKASVVLQRSIPNRQIGIKARVSSDRTIALCYQSVLKNYGKWTVGWEVKDLGNLNTSSYGLQFELNL